MKDNVVADQVAQSQGAHRMVEAQFAYGVDIFFGCYAFHQSLDSFVDHGDNDAVAYEAREVCNFNRGFADFFGYFFDFCERIFRSSDAVDEFDQFHDRSRVEEVHADNFVRTFCSCADLRDGQRGRVAGQDRVFRAEFVLIL